MWNFDRIRSLLVKGIKEELRAIAENELVRVVFLVVTAADDDAIDELLHLIEFEESRGRGGEEVVLGLFILIKTEN